MIWSLSLSYLFFITGLWRCNSGVSFFPSWEGRTQTASGQGLVTRKTNQVIRGVRSFSSPVHLPAGRGEGLETEFNHQRPAISPVMPIQWNLGDTRNDEAWGALGLVNTLMCWECAVRRKSMEAPSSPLCPQTLPYASLPLGCSWVVFYIVNL